MSECNKGTCNIGTNQNRGSHFKLKCIACGLEKPLEYQRKHSIICPSCIKGALIWIPNKTKKEGEKKNE